MKIKLQADVPEDEYHRDQALSSSGARLIMDTCPAVFKWKRDFPDPPKEEYDIGHGAHREVLGAGPKLVRLNFANRRTNAFKEADAEARAAGFVPLLASEYAKVRAMAAVVRAHPLASALLGDGAPEVSGFWADLEFGIQRRVRFDWLPSINSRGRTLLPDFKTAASSNPVKIKRSMYNFGYHCQGAWYLDAAIEAGHPRDSAFVLIVQEKTEPYLVSCVQIDSEAIKVGRERNKIAMEKFADCLDSDVWPDYTEGRTDLPVISLPPYAYRDEEDFE